MDNADVKPGIMSLFSRHLFGFMVVFAIIIAFALVLVSMMIYYSSGASQLDLSSPSYVDVRDQIDKSDDFKQYSSTGKMDSSAISDFKLLFDQKVEKVKMIDAFGSDPLNPVSLGMGETVATDPVAPVLITE